MHIILGPPGTGKTTRLLNLVEESLAKGISPEKIGYFSFTRRAAQEAILRASIKFRMAQKDLLYFRTLHSFALLRTGISKKKIMTYQHFMDCAQWLSIDPFSELTVLEEGPYQDFGFSDKFLGIINMSRITRVPLYEVYKYSTVPLTTDWSKVDYVNRGLTAYKKSHDLYDFTDLLEEFLRHDLSPEFDVVFVDEAQDLSPIQWEMVHQIARKSGQVYVAGDDDQAIYRWAGADVDQFIRLGGKVEVLGQSYRIPRSHHVISQNVITRVHHRRIKDFKPRDEEGSVKWHWSEEEVNLDAGDWLLLSRTKKGAKQLEKSVRQRGLFYTYSGSKDINHSALDAIRVWEDLRMGKAFLPKDIRMVYRFMMLGEQVMRGHKTLPSVEEDKFLTMQELIADHGLLTDEPWEDALAAIPDEESRYYKACLRRGEDFSKAPRIRISTIHTAKGAEATNVLLLTDVPKKSNNSMANRLHTEDDELRVFYVGLTRAKSELHLIHPQNNGRRII